MLAEPALGLLSSATIPGFSLSLNLIGDSITPSNFAGAPDSNQHSSVGRQRAQVALQHFSYCLISAAVSFLDLLE
jgi:hypothetical protein